MEVQLIPFEWQEHFEFGTTIHRWDYDVTSAHYFVGGLSKKKQTLTTVLFWLH